jgi:hypothetical protein
MKKVIAFLFLSSLAQAFTQVTVSSSAPAGFEVNWLQDNAARYNFKIDTNTFVGNTYTAILYGTNPSYNPQPTNMDLLNAIVTVDSWTYVAGWANGESYQQFTDGNIIDSYLVNCSTPTLFLLNQTSSTTFDPATCQDVLSTISDIIFNESASTPTVVPGNFQ